MVHSSQDVRLIDLRCVAPTDLSILSDLMGGFNHACLIILPPCGQPGEYVTNLDSIGSVVSGLARSLGPDATLVTVGEVIDLVEVQSMMPPNMRYHHWVSIKKTTPSFAISDVCRAIISGH